MITPNSLLKGDRIGLISPSSPTIGEKVEKSISIIKELGFIPILGESCYVAEDYLSGSDEIRAHDINKMFNDESIKGIWCLRGGYGTPRILDLLDYQMIKANPKVFIGYSDITALHIAFNQICNLITYHGPMVSTELINEFDEFSIDNILNHISGKIKDDFIINPLGEDLIFLNDLNGKGKLVGGNLSLIASTIGTEYEVDTRGKILFLEDVDEPPYRIDRMLSQLRLSGKLNDAAGFLIGDWNNCVSQEGYSTRDTDFILKEYLQKLEKPTVMNLKAGHCHPMITLAMGREIEINGSKNTLKWT